MPAPDNAPLETSRTGVRPVSGGVEIVTLGANWYLTSHFKLQANYIKAYSDKGNLSLDPTIFELRGQLMF